MYQKIIKNDVRKNKVITITITGFIMLAALFTALGVSSLVNLLGAIDHLMLDAKAPHYVQMHSGEIDQERLEQFAADYPDVENLQVSEFLNIEGEDIIIGEQSLSGSVQDNGLSVQNEKFDFLLDLNNQIIHPQDGEIYVPIYYMKEGAAGIGDTVTVQNVSFTIAGFLRDSQMNSAMSSSKRFLVSENNYEQVKAGGKLEYLIEFRFSKDVDIGKFESAYINAGLEDNGPSGSYDLIKLMNGISDGIVIAMLLLVSLLILLISFLCVRFTLIAKVEEDYREIGVLKAIGLRVSEIKKLYIAKYSAIAAGGCGLGFLVSLVMQKSIMANIHLYMGRSGTEILGTLLGGCGAVLVFLIVMIYVSGVLRRFRKISAVQAIRYGAPMERSKASGGFLLINNQIFSSTAFLGIKDVFSRIGLYLIMLFVLVISCFIMVVPQNINNTISDRSFMTYMGIGECDMRLDIQLADDIPAKTKDIEQMLMADSDIEKYNILTCWMFDMPMNDESIGKLRVELGDHSVFPLTYEKGREPRQENEIALSILNGNELEKGIGDTIVLKVDGQKRELTVCGLYSDITNGGMTAKAAFHAEGEKAMWSKIPVKLKDTSMIDQTIVAYKEQFAYAKVSKVDDYIEQDFGTIMKTTKLVSTTAIAVSMLLTILITLLFMKMLVIKDRYQISVLKSLGFTSKSIKRQYLVRSAVVLLSGIVVGTIAANTLGELVGVLLMSSFGVATFHFKINWLFAYLISPLLVGGCVYAATRFGISDIGSIKVSEYIKE